MLLCILFLGFTFGRLLSFKAVIVVVNLKVRYNAIQHSLKWYTLTAVKKYNLAALSIFMTPGSFNYMEGAGRHARPSVDGRPPMQCLCCLSKWSESRQPWLQASVTAGLECVPIAHSKQRDPNLSTILIHSKLLPHLTPWCMSSAALCTLSFCKICLWLLCLSSLMLTHQ